MFGAATDATCILRYIPPLTVRFAHLIALTFLSHERGLVTMAKSRAFAFIGPSLWNQLPSSSRSLILSGGPRCLKTTLFARSLSHWERLLLVFTVSGAL